MRHGYTTALKKRLERHNPSARLVLEAVTTVKQDVKDRRADWAAADSLTGLTVLDDGGVTLTGTPTTYIDQSTDDGSYLSDLDDASPFEAAMVRWNQTAEIQHREITTLVANLVNRRDGGQPGEVTFWRARLFRVAKISLGADGNDLYELQQIGQHVDVAAGGYSTSPADVTFNFTYRGVSPRVGPPPVIEDADQIATGKTTHSYTVVMIAAMKGEGEAAGNVGWTADGTTPVTTLGSDVVSHEVFSLVSDAKTEQSGRTSFSLSSSPGDGVPRLQLKGGGYSQTTIAFTAAGNDIDLGSAPESGTRLQIEAQGQTPSDSSLTFQLDDGGGMVTVVDGDVIGEDNTPTGGTDLSGMTRQQAYDAQVVLDPSTNAEVAPIARRFSVREITWEDLDELVQIGDATWQVDPIELRGNIPEITFTLFRDGLRDYRDAATELLSDHYVGALEFRLWVGHPDLARKDWLHIDDFVIDEQHSTEEGLVLACISPIALINRVVPAVSGTTRTPLEYATDIADAYEDILTAQIATFPSRRIGALVEDSSTAIAKTIDDPVKAKVALDQLAYIAGHGVIGSQGRLKAVDMMTDSPPVAEFPSETITVLRVSPGYEERIPDVSVHYGWDSTVENDFDGESHSYVTNAIANYGRAPLAERTEHIDPEISKWIPGVALAKTIADRITTKFSTGLILWSFESIYPMPHLEPGDTVAVESDLFVARDPHNGAALRGNMWALGKVAAVYNSWGTRFTVWVQSYANIIPANEGITRTGFGDPEIAVTWSPAVATGPDPAGQEAVTFFVSSRSSQVAFWYQAYLEGFGPAAWAAASHRHTNTDGSPDATGYATEPFRFRLQVARPAEGGTPVIIRYRGEDGNGKFSEEKTIIVDGDLVPSGSVDWDIDRKNLHGIFTPQTLDPDTGSWRCRMRRNALGTNTFDSLAFNDSLAEEFKGSSFGTPVTLTGSTLALSVDTQLNGVIQFFRTTSTTAATQASSLRSKEVHFTIVLGDEGELRIEMVGYEFQPSTLNKMKAFIEFKLGAKVASYNVSWTALVKQSGGGPASSIGPFANTYTGSSVTLEDTSAEYEFGDLTADIVVTVTPYESASLGGRNGRAIVFNLGNPSKTGAGLRVDDNDGGSLELYGKKLELAEPFRATSGTDGPKLGIKATFAAGNKTSSWDPDFSNGPSQTVNLTGATTVGLPTNMPESERLLLLMTNSSNASFHASYLWPGGEPSHSGTTLFTIFRIGSSYVIYQLGGLS